MYVMSQDVVEHYYKGHRLADSIEDWAEEVSSATEEMEFVEPTKPQAKMPRIGDPSKEIQIAILLERHNEAREIMKLIEEQLLKLGCEIPQGAISKSSSSKHGGLNHLGGLHREYFTEDSEAQGLLSQDTWAYIPLDSASEALREKKKKRSKRPKTEEEKNRHINKVFMRENGILPLLDPSSQL
ncbi:hypothetical protein BFJ68_g10507 [Fusarium oxysporum]|uniref:Uncharacterized protein n=2 Tax=Fusarium oxysporum TaxID=5507 RepID=A0A420QMP3_FUSOX|nr:hypothetical protein BFJ65_g15528 [Fusarium oxysporum f. sp. cepae]RKK26821.1 hypothetical protein BFJ67_g16453 [Fusarium oxysporum f. sp. cepae]RKK27535.1 hypothetical protein BFJ66_g16610 [Fusarium oxysporum f. sp. cepae]RKL06039.1 hypothetical protein BFJ68_g10507 [Fusarium oxysporum]